MLQVKGFWLQEIKALCVKKTTLTVGKIPLGEDVAVLTRDLPVALTGGKKFPATWLAQAFVQYASA